MRRIKGINDLPEQMTILDEGLERSPLSKEEIKEYREIFSFLVNKEDWKMPTKEFTTTNLALAGKIADVLTYYTEGSEIHFIGEGTIEGGANSSKALITVFSKGYYHYTGV